MPVVLLKLFNMAASIYVLCKRRNPVPEIKVS
uniref:Uncharacterized protein n=1 Tax=Anguilla anguilla TaxID=7936 RepID=A0A0E9UF88_ANGAN